MHFIRFALISFLSLASLTFGADAQTLPLSAGGSAESAEPAINPEEMSKEAIDAMVARMSDDEVRALLLDRLDAVAASPEAVVPETTIVEKIGVLWRAFYASPLSAIQNLPQLVSVQASAIQAVAGYFGGLSGILTLLGLTALVLVIGFAVEYAVRTWIIRMRNPEAHETTHSLREAVGFLFKRLLREVFGLIVFFTAIRITGRLLLTPEQLSVAAPLVSYLIWMPRLAAAFSRFIMAPERPEFRLVNVSDHWARFIHRHLIGLVLLGGATLFVVDFNLLAGVEMGATRIGFWFDSAVYVYIAYIAWFAREGLSDMMRGTDPDRTEFDEAIARLYPVFAIGLAFAMWVAVQIIIGLNQTIILIHAPHYVTLFWLLITPAIDTGVRGLVRHLLPPMQGEGPVAEEAYRSTKRSYIRIGRVLSVALVILLIAQAWNVSMRELLFESEGILDNLFGFAMTVIVGYVVYEAVSLWVNRRLAAEFTAMGLGGEESEAGEIGGAGQSRLSTILPLALVTARSTIIVIFGLLAIGNLGIDITPLLAGAGIAGLAIGFGAQKLVTDVVSGVFFLVDDAFRTGEYVEIDGTMGSVEKISIRSMQLRHHRGPVHTIPYGEIPKLTNYSRDWVIMKLKFIVNFDTDPNKVKKIFKKIGQEMMQEELYKDDFLQPFKSQGVFDIDDVGMVIRGKFMAKPGKQFMIRKEIYNRVKSAFAENGVEFARREVRVAIPELEHHEDMTDAEKAAIAAAAAGAVQQQDEQAGDTQSKGPDG